MTFATRGVPAWRIAVMSSRWRTSSKCGGKLKIVAYLHDQVAIKQILEHLGLSPPEEAKPPPAAHQVVRMPVDEECRQFEAP